MRVDPVCGNACGAGRARARFEAASVPFGARTRGGVRAPRDQGRFFTQSCARALSAGVRVFVRSRRQELFLSRRSRLLRRIFRRHFLCGDERVPRRARPVGRGQRGKAAPAVRAAVRARRVCKRGVNSGENLSGRGGGAGRGNALSLRDAGKKDILRRGRLLHSHLARVLALSALLPERTVFGTKENSRKGSDPPYGVFRFPRRAGRDRRLFLSRAGRAGNRAFSFLYFSPVSFQAAPQESTFRRQADRECRWRSSQGRA